MKIGDEVYIHGYIDEIRSDVIIIRNEGGYFGTDPSEILLADCKTEPNYSENLNDCDTCRHRDVSVDEFPCNRCYKDDSYYKPKNDPQTERSE